MFAVKANRQYTITEAESGRYQDEGYDILADDGKVLKTGKGKTVPYAKYQEALDLNTKLQVQVTDLQKQLETVTKK
jgi:hypothetical protein